MEIGEKKKMKGEVKIKTKKEDIVKRKVQRKKNHQNREVHLQNGPQVQSAQ